MLVSAVIERLNGDHDDFAHDDLDDFDHDHDHNDQDHHNHQVDHALLHGPGFTPQVMHQCLGVTFYVRSGS